MSSRSRAQQQALNDNQSLDRLQCLLTMLSYRRPMDSATEGEYRAEYLHDLPSMTSDPYSNLHAVLPRHDGSTSRVLWSCHTDTVHRDDGRQPVAVTGQYMQLAHGADSNCLGADDTVGVWIMREMILAGVPGHYVFHHGEERGGIGSGDVTRYEPERFADALYAIAFDRRGTTDVITHQAGGRCASDAFAHSLARQLRPVAKYRPSAEGVYTDTAEYAHIVPECTNVSVGYEHEHSTRERVDYWHAIALLVTLCRFDETKLIDVRDLDEARRQRDERQNLRRLIASWRLDRDRFDPLPHSGGVYEDEGVIDDDWMRAASWPSAYGRAWRIKKGSGY